MDTILYPDESRIHLAIPAIEDCLIERERSRPRNIRLLRAKDGTLFWRPKDSDAFSRSEHTLLLDDAINSGGTVRQMLASAAALGRSLQSMLLYVLISRQTQGHEDLLRVMSAVTNVPFAYKCFVHFPVTFFNEADCPFCMRQRLATVLAVSPGPGSAAATAMEELAESLRPAFMYGRPRSSTRPQEPTSRYTVPVLRDGQFMPERFDTLSGAKACLAVSIAKQRDMDVRTAVALLKHCSGNVLLWAYALYSLASRNVTRGAFWQDEVFRQSFVDACQRVGKELPRRLPLDVADPIADGALDLTVAAWVAPEEALPWALATLISEADALLSYEFLQNELFLLSFRLATVKLQKRDGESHAVDRLRSAVGTAQKRISQSRGPQRVLPLDAIERLIRLRQVLQIAESERLTEPWLEGLVYLLSRLSYKGGHEFIGYVNRRDLAEGLRLCESVGGLLNKTASLQGQDRPSDPDQVFGEIARFLSPSRNDLSYLASALGPVLSNWLRALEVAGELPNGFRSVEPLILAAQAAAKLLLASTGELAGAVRDRDLALAMRALQGVVSSQKKLYDAVYEHKEVDSSQSLRGQIEARLCPLYDLAPRLSRRRILNEFGEMAHSVRLTGSFFEYADTVERQHEFGEKAARWSVLLAPISFAESILTDVIAVNPCKHVVPGIGIASSIEIHVALDGFESIEQKIVVRTEVSVDGRPRVLPEHVWRKTLGRQRILLSVYGGDIRVAEGRTTESSVVVVEFRSGHF